MSINFKPMVETFLGSSYDFMALAKMDRETADNLAKQLLVQEGYTVPVPPVLEAAPERPVAPKKTYYTIKFKFERDYDYTLLAFEKQEDCARVAAVMDEMAGRILRKGYSDDLSTISGKFTNAETSSFVVSQYTDDQKALVKEIEEIGNRNKAVESAYNESCETLNKQREWIREERDKALEIMNNLKLLAQTFLSTNAIVNDADKTMALLQKNHRNAILSLIDQIPGGDMIAMDDEAIKKFGSHIGEFIQEYAATLKS